MNLAVLPVIPPAVSVAKVYRRRSANPRERHLELLSQPIRDQCGNVPLPVARGAARYYTR
jgi:hypothetical protein